MNMVTNAKFLVAVPFMTFVLASVPVSAQINNTGPGSNNTIEENNTNNVECKNDNNTDINVDSNQDAGSGSATNSGNTNGGGAQSGDAESDLEVGVRVKDSNGNCVNANTNPGEPTNNGGGATNGDNTDKGNKDGNKNGNGAVLGDSNTTTPVGGVNAGAGGTSATNTALASFGLLGSMSILALGIRRALSFATKR